MIIMGLFLYKNICCRYSLEAPSEVLLMSTHNICFYGEIRNYKCVHSTWMPLPRPLAPPRGMTLGQWYHTLKGLDVGKCHTKFQLSSPEDIKVISCKRNADVNLHLNLQVNLNLVMNVTYTRTDATSRQNAICPTPAKADGQTNG